MAAEYVIDNNDANEPHVPAPASQGNGKEETVTIPKAELDRMNRELTEIKQSERSWADIARRGGVAQTQTVTDDEPDDFDAASFEDPNAADLPADDTPEKLVEEIAAKGTKAISDRGYVTAKQAHKIAVDTARAVAEHIVERKYQKVTTDAQIFAEFPELKDPKSDLFKATADRFHEAVKLDPRAAKTPVALYLAAKAAKVELERENPRTRRDPDENEDDRRLRARSQDSRPSGRSAADDLDDMMGDQAKTVIAGMGISPEEFKASQQQLLGSRSGRRR